MNTKLYTICSYMTTNGHVYMHICTYVGLIGGGVATNVVSAEATAQVHPANIHAFIYSHTHIHYHCVHQTSRAYEN